MVGIQARHSAKYTALVTDESQMGEDHVETKLSQSRVSNKYCSQVPRLGFIATAR